MIFAYQNFYSERQQIKIITFKEFLDRGADMLFNPHKLNFYGFIFVKQGRLEQCIGDKNLIYEAGDVLFLGPGQTHHLTKYENIDAYVLSFTEEFFLATTRQDHIVSNYKLLLDYSIKIKLLTNSSNFEIIKTLCDVLFLESRNPYSKSQDIILQNILSSILLSLKRSNLKAEQDIEFPDKYYHIAFQYKMLLHQYAMQENQLQFYLDKLQVSQSTLQTATKHVFHKSPKVVFDDTLTLIAKQLLEDSSKRISEISFMLGFTEHTNFSKFFKKNTGYSPETYRSLLVAD